MRTFFLGLLLLSYSSCFNEPKDNQEPEPSPLEQRPSTADLISESGAAVPLYSFQYQDEMVLLPSDSDSPVATFDVNTVIPAAEDPQLNQLINKDLADIIVGEEAPIKVSNLSQTLKNAITVILYNYGQQDVDSVELSVFRLDYTFDKKIETKVLLNRNGILSLSTNHFSYTGGAHADFLTVLDSYDVNNNKSLQLNNLVDAASIPALGNLIMKNIDRGRMYDEDTVAEPSDNFALTDKGILFSYEPYSIGPYISGEIEALVPYDEVVGILKPEAKLLVASLQ